MSELATIPDSRAKVPAKGWGRCWYCGVMPDPSRWHSRPTIDHLTPLSRGGTHFLDNLVPACVACHASKGHDTLEEFRARWQRRLHCGHGPDAHLYFGGEPRDWRDPQGITFSGVRPMRRLVRERKAVTS
jgi:hypothetical protein